MNKNTLIILAIIIIPMIAYFALSKSKVENTAEAKINTPQMIKFASSMCYDCQRLQDVLKDVYPNFANKVVLTEISVQNNSSAVQNMIKKYRVKLVPTSVFIDKDGKVVNQVEGYIDKDTLEKYLSEISDNG